MPAAHIILIPGLLGFQRLGRLTYFTDVEPLLGQAFARAGKPVEVSVIATPPTSSIQARAARLAEEVAATPDGAEVFLVGHSTGGLDERMFLSPGVSLPTRVDVEAAARKVRAAVSLSTPHHGSPLASAITGVHGHRLMSVISRILAMRLPGRNTPSDNVLELSKLVLQIDHIAGVKAPSCDRLREHVEEAVQQGDQEIDPEIVEWLAEVGQDSTLLEQLTPKAVRALTSALQERPGVQRGCVVTRGPKPRLRTLTTWSSGRYAQLTGVLYVVLHRLAGAVRRRDVAKLDSPQRMALELALGKVPGRSDNDGFVPTRSQVWGTVVAAVQGDHLDLMGYYGGRPEQPRLDMLSSGSGFDWRDFESTWHTVSRFLLAASRG